jgi:hypothetical protein
MAASQAVADPTSTAKVRGLNASDTASIDTSRHAYQTELADAQKAYQAKLDAYNSWRPTPTYPGQPFDIGAVLANTRPERPTPPDATRSQANWSSWASGTEIPQAVAQQWC